MQKLDPYLNVDPGTMNPFQHGEVFVTDDGAETDLDVGHYERFLDTNLHGSANVTTGQVYSTVIAKERRGEYLGDTVQVIPHITNEIKSRIRRMATDDIDVVITEVGGTVGDIESLPFLEAVRQVRHEIGRQRLLSARVAVAVHRTLRRAEDEADPALRSGAAVDRHPARCHRAAVRPGSARLDQAQDLASCAMSMKRPWSQPWTRPSIYDIPGCCTPKDSTPTSCAGSAAVPRRRLVGVGMPCCVASTNRPTNSRLRWWANTSISPTPTCRSPKHCAPAASTTTAGCRCGGSLRRLCHARRCGQGVAGSTPSVCPGGFGVRGIDGKVGALRHARQNRIPTLGLCLGLQCMVIEYARTELGWDDANSMEFDETTEHPVIATMAEQLDVVSGSVTWAAHATGAVPGETGAGVTGRAAVQRTVRRRAPPAPVRGEQLACGPNWPEAGLSFSGTSPDGRLVGFVELPQTEHPFFVGTQAHPEFRSRPTRAHPLFAGLVEAALKLRQSDAQPVTSGDPAAL